MRTRRGDEGVQRSTWPRAVGRRAPGTAAAGLLLVLAGCSADGDAEPQPDGAAGVGTTSTEQEAGAAADDTATADLDATVEDLQDAAGEDTTDVTGELPVVATRAAASPDGAYEVDLNGVTVQDELMTVVFTYRQVDGDRTRFLGGMFDDQISQGGPSGPGRFSTDGVYVLDTAEGTRHLAAYDSEERCVCSWGLHATSSVEAGSSVVLSTTFSAPPEGTEVVDVVIPTVEVFSGVPVQR